MSQRLTIRLRRACNAPAAIVLWLMASTAIASSQEDHAAVMRLTPSLEHGAQRFEGCARCHHPAAAEPAAERIPRIAGQHATVLAKQLIEFRGADRLSERMQRVTGAHDFDLQAIADVAAFASRAHLPAPSPRIAADPAEPAAALYRRHCSSCHGADAKGSAERAIPRLAGQQYDYLLEQIYDVEHGRRRNVPARHPSVFGKLGVDELRDIADYLSRLPWTDAKPGSVSERSQDG